jgi:hypothetical protein
MKIDFERSGGQLPVVLSAHVNTDQLSPSDADAVRQLTASARMDELKDSSPNPMPDVYTYRLVLTTDKGERREVELTETSIPSRLRPLLRWLTEIATPEPL